LSRRRDSSENTARETTYGTARRLCCKQSALFASVQLDRSLAEFALDAATPVELAAASLGHQLSRRRVAASTAHEVAAVRAGGLAVALATASSRGPELSVSVAEATRRLDEDEVVTGGTVEGAVALNQTSALAVEHDLGGGVVTISQSVAGLAKRRQLVPARSYTA